MSTKNVAVFCVVLPALSRAVARTAYLPSARAGKLTCHGSTPRAPSSVRALSVVTHSLPFQKRPETNRSNPYLIPGGYAKLVSGLPVFSSYLCTQNPLPTLSSSLDSTTTSVAGTVLTIGQLVSKYFYTADPSGPPCTSQTPLGTATHAGTGLFPGLKALP